ncbi:hypothetical protein ACWDTP_09240 [Mycobacterium sp. NPDC003449]
MNTGKIFSGIAVIWLVSGGIAAYQRDYFSSGEITCATVTSIAMTVIVGPLNYRGVNAEATDCDLPEPSQ